LLKPRERVASAAANRFHLLLLFYNRKTEVNDVGTGSPSLQHGFRITTCARDCETYLGDYSTPTGDSNNARRCDRLLGYCADRALQEEFCDNHRNIHSQSTQRARFGFNSTCIVLGSSLHVFEHQFLQGVCARLRESRSLIPVKGA
jgi:hypothetical protein